MCRTKLCLIADCQSKLEEPTWYIRVVTTYFKSLPGPGLGGRLNPGSFELSFIFSPLCCLRLLPRLLSPLFGNTYFTAENNPIQYFGSVSAMAKASYIDDTTSNSAKVSGYSLLPLVHLNGSATLCRQH